MRDLGTTLQISCTKGSDVIKIGQWAWFNPLSGSRRIIIAKRRRVRSKRSVREKRSVAETMEHIISSTSTQEKPFTRENIVEEQTEIMFSPGRVVMVKRSATLPITSNRRMKTTQLLTRGDGEKGEKCP